jgi:broad specificity phosphatase PhoE
MIVSDRSAQRFDRYVRPEPIEQQQPEHACGDLRRTDQTAAAIAAVSGGYTAVLAVAEIDPDFRGEAGAARLSPRRQADGSKIPEKMVAADGCNGGGAR